MAMHPRAQVVARTCVAPFERVKLEMLLHGREGGSLGVAHAILAAEGVAGFWKGNTLNVLRTAPYKARLLPTDPGGLCQQCHACHNSKPTKATRFHATPSY